MKKQVSIRQIFLAGLLVGSLDILSAFVDYYISTGKGPAGVLNYVASGVFGKSAFGGDSRYIIYGLIFHFIIAFLFTIFFFLLYTKTKLLPKNRIVAGVVYGLFVWIIMNVFVVQFSNAPHAPLNAMDPLKALKSLLILIFMIGLPLSFFAGRITKTV